MKKLEKEIKKNGFTYIQVMRTNKVAWYEQRLKGGQLVGNEVFVIKIGKEAELFGVTVLERELFPSDADFGLTAFSTGLNEAATERRYYELIMETNMKEVAKETIQWGLEKVTN